MEKWLQKLIISSVRNSLKFGLRYKTCPPYHAPGIPEFQFFSHTLSYFARRTLNSGSQSSFDFCAGRHCQGRRWHKLFAAANIISGRLPARPITRTADYPHRPIIAYGEKKKTDYPHWWITHTFGGKNVTFKLKHFSLFRVVWSNFRKLESFFVEFKGQRNSDACTIVSILACTLLIKLYSKKTSGPCPNLNVSYSTECEFVAIFCASDRSAPCWFVERKLGEC